MRPLRVLIGSGNLGNAKPSVESLEAWIPNDGNIQQVLEHSKYPITSHQKDKKNFANDEKFDLIVLGLQEATFGQSNDGKAFPLDASHSSDATSTKRNDMADSIHSVARKAVTSSARNVTKMPKGVVTIKGLTARRNHKDATVELVADGTAALHKLLQDRLPSYQRLLSFQRGEMRLMIYVLSNTLWSIQVKSVRAQNTGKGGLIANKGGIVAEVQVNEETTLSFLSCHLEAHEGMDKYKTRCSSLADIFKGTKKFAIPAIYPDASIASHFCFVLGDLNFRTRLLVHGDVKQEEQIHTVQQLIADQNWDELNEVDELKRALENHDCLFGFETLMCNFPPTFKVKRGNGYSYKENRTPSYTDRILWKSGNLLNGHVIPLCYEPIDNFTSSDHKPIRGAFEIQLNDTYILPQKQHASPSLFSKKHEKLHLFLSEIQCDIFHGDTGQSPPDTYVCMVSDPRKLLLSPPSKYQQCIRALRKVLGMQDYSPVDPHEMDRWPHTITLRDTFTPNWKDAEIHCAVKAHHKDGCPINLGGAILHIFLFKDNGRQVNEVIGSYPVNLEYLFRLCAKIEGSEHEHGSWHNIMHEIIKEKASHHGGTLYDSADDKMISLDIDGPLLKNGMQTGVLRCSLDAWWVSDGLAQASKASTMAMGLSSNEGHLARAREARENWMKSQPARSFFRKKGA